MQQDFNSAFAEVDVLASPTAPTTAWKIGERVDDPMVNYINDATTIPTNLAGIPGMSLPVGLAAEDGLPVGLQLMAPQYADDRLYRIGVSLETLIAQREGKQFWELAPALGEVK